MHTINLLASLVEHNQTLVYLIIFIGLVLEGEFIIISAGILAHLGALNLWFAFVFIILGGFSKTFLGYAVGELLFKKFNNNRVFQYIEKKVLITMPRFEDKPFWSIFVSKFIMMNHLVIIFSGYKKINYKKYLKAEIFATIIWAPILLSLGYFFSFTALRVSSEIWRFSMVILVLFIIFVIFDKFVSWLYELFEEFYDEKNK